MKNKKLMNRKMINKKVLAGLTICAMAFSLTACGGDSASASKLQGSNSVEEAINQQIEKEKSTEASTEELPQTLVVPPTESTTEQAAFEVLDKESAEALFGQGSDDNGAASDSAGDKSDSSGDNAALDSEENSESGVSSIEEAKTDVDIDLTVMNSNMVYSTVYQMMAEAPDYVGKTVRMKGTYYSSYDETTDTRYFFIIIQDATACCQQGLEFIWDDGSHKFPDEYPEDGTEAVVAGTFETYKDNPDDVYEYIRLKDASFEVQN